MNKNCHPDPSLWGTINTEHFSVGNNCKWPQYANSCDGGQEILPE